MSGYVSAGAWPAAADARPPALADGGGVAHPPDVAGASELTLVIVGSSSSSSQTVPDRVDRLMLARSTTIPLK